MYTHIKFGTSQAVVGVEVDISLNGEKPVGKRMKRKLSKER